MKEITQSRQQEDKAGRYQTGLGERRARVHTVNEISNWIKKQKKKEDQKWIMGVDEMG